MASTLTLPILNFSTTSTFRQVWNDSGSGADRSGAFYRPTPGDGFFILGDYGQDNYGEPTEVVQTIQVGNDDPSKPALAVPQDYRRIYQDSGSGPKVADGSFWAPVPPPGYVACGHVIQAGHGKPTAANSPGLDKLRCLRLDLAKKVDLGGRIWDDRGSGGDEDVAVFTVPDLNVLFATTSYDPGPEKVYIPSTLG